MTRVQLKRRDRLAAKHRSAIARWPSRSGAEFAGEMRGVVRDLEALARELDSSSQDEAERKRTWELVSQARRDLAAAAGREHESGWDGPFGQLRAMYERAVGEGKVPPPRQELLDAVMERLAPEIAVDSSSESDPGLSRSRLSDLMRSMVHVIADPSEGGPPITPESRAGRVWREIARLKLSLFQETNRPFIGNDEWRMGFDLLLRCSSAGTALYKSRDDDIQVGRHEVEVLRPIARDARLFALRDHLMVCTPALPVSPVVHDPNAVFFAGAERGRQLLSRLCAERGLTLLGHSEPKDPALTRWDHLRACNVAVFDMDGDLASVCYDLGVALTRGKPMIVAAGRGRKLPFDVDVEPVWLDGDAGDSERLATALDSALYGWQRTREGSSVAVTLAHLCEAFRGHADFRVRRLLESLGAETARDAVAARRAVESLLGAVGPKTPEMIFPAWPASYPDPTNRRCFHVTPFGPDWANRTMEVVKAACRRARTEYVRGDRVLDPAILRSIWDNICTATHIVVDLTGLNPNVALELGIARALGRNLLIVTQDASPERYFPAIAKVRMHRYEAIDDHLKTLDDPVSQFLNA